MIDQVANLLLHHLTAEEKTVNWRLASPKDQADQVNDNPHACLYLYDVREAVEYRDNTPIRRQQDGVLREFRPTIHVNAAFLICAIRNDPKPLESAKILSAVGRYVQRHGLLSYQTVADLLQALPGIPDAEPFAQGELANQIANETYIPLRLSLGTEGPLGHPELWSALDIKQRPSLTLIATISLADPTGILLDAPPVKDHEIRLREIKSGNVPTPTEILSELGVSFQIQGRAIDAANAPLAGATVAVSVRGKSLSVSATTDEDGKFAFHLFLAKGEYDIQLRGTTRRLRPNGPPERLMGELHRKEAIQPIFDENTGIPHPVVVQWDLKLTSFPSS